jgi:hypothetical protein
MIRKHMTYESTYRDDNTSVSCTGTCFIQKIYAPSSSLLQGKHLPHFASIFFTYLWSFRWPNYIVTLPKYFSFRLPHLNINTGPPSSELDKNIQRKSHFLIFSHWNGYSHFRSVLNWFRNTKKGALKIKCQ